jgi:hypothetical protein
MFWVYVVPSTVSVWADVEIGASTPAVDAGSLIIGSAATCIVARYGATTAGAAVNWAWVAIVLRPVSSALPLRPRTCSIAVSASWIAACRVRCRLTLVRVFTKNGAPASMVTLRTASATTISRVLKPSSPAIGSRSLPTRTPGVLNR